MPEDTPETPDQQDNPGQQDNGSSGTPPAGYVEKARYDGLVRKVEELTLSNRDLNAQLGMKTSEIEQLKGQLSVKDTEKTVAVGERDKALQNALQEVADLKSQLESLNALKLKVEVAQELGRPELLKIAERLPNMTDKEALTTVMQDFAGFADDLVKQRESQLLAGITPLISTPQSTPSAPQSEQAWNDHINSLPLGSSERNKALNDFGDWLEKKHSTQ